MAAQAPCSIRPLPLARLLATRSSREVGLLCEACLLGGLIPAPLCPIWRSRTLQTPFLASASWKRPLARKLRPGSVCTLTLQHLRSSSPDSLHNYPQTPAPTSLVEGSALAIIITIIATATATATTTPL